MTTTQKHAGIVALVGLPNAGKSTLVNALVGQKVSIVTPKAQTTRFRIRGIAEHKNTQIVLTDTPGLFFSERAFDQAMLKEAEAALSDADVVVVVVDATKKLNDKLTTALELIGKARKRRRLALVINKVDEVAKPALLEYTQEITAQFTADAVFMVSALKRDGVGDVKKWLAAEMPEGEWLFPADDVSDMALKHMATEITREHCFMLLQQEIPYGVHVAAEQWEDKSKGLAVISQAIVVGREAHKKLVIGKGGSMLKQIGARARKDIERLIGKKVHLQIHVKVDAKWQEKLVRSGMQADVF